MRPRGEISLAVEACLAQRGPATFSEIAQAARVGRRIAQRTLGNMRRAGLVEVVELRAHAAGNRPLCVYGLRAPDADTPSGLDVLQSAMRQFHCPSAEGR